MENNQMATFSRIGRSLALILLCACAAACVSPPLSPQQAAEDKAITEQVYGALLADDVYYYRHVTVEVDNGVAQLSGYVWSQDAMYHAKQLAGRVPGVVRVINQMELERNGSR